MGWDDDAREERADRLQEEVRDLNRMLYRLDRDEENELVWLARRWVPESAKEAHPEMAARMAELVLKSRGCAVTMTAPRWSAHERAQIDCAEAMP